MNKNEVQKLAKLARVYIEDSEAETLSHEFENILNYVGEIKEANLGTSEIGVENKELVLKNVMREDTLPHEPGLYTKELLREVPQTEAGFVKAKKIL